MIQSQPITKRITHFRTIYIIFSAPLFRHPFYCDIYLPFNIEQNTGVGLNDCVGIEELY